jgi:hypothetical protein
MSARDAFAVGGRQDDDTAQARPISTAPRVKWAPLLLWLQDDSRWYIGFWENGHWYEDSGCRMAPVAWAPLPPRPVLP